ncbi:hypothetical protein ACIOC1_07505 [Streptomyces sp. NPDC088197]|uniref:hypothetical protein n=1 Tax=unclassified Streptomyces TaxID=2593676 RepID=UPI0033A69830
MLWEAVAYVALGLGAAYAAARLFPLRLPLSPLLLATGPIAALLGGLVTRTIVGPGHPEATLPAALAVGAAMLSVLARPPKRGRHAKVTASSV